MNNNWQLNEAGDWELTTAEKRYRIEEMLSGFWLYKKPLELSAHKELIGRYNSLDDAMSAIKTIDHCK